VQASASTRTPPRAVHLAAALLCVVVGAVACDDAEPTGDGVRDLVVLSGDVGDTRITAFRGAPGEEIDVPDRATAWISGNRTGGLVATLADGRLAVLDDPSVASGTWRIVDPTTDGESIGSLLFAAISPDGSRAASMGLGSAGQFGLTLSDLATGQSVAFPIDGEPMLTSPAWLDDERVAVVVVDPDTVGAISIVDAASGDLTGGPGNVRSLAVSADGAVVAWTSTVDGRLYGSNAPSWLAGEEIAALAIEAQGGTTPGSFALDGTGNRIAIVWEDETGQVASIAVHARTAAGWSPVQRFEAPGGDPRAVVTWLR
jgi:hypothetical protein